jgi:hypothetical protein
MRGVVRSRPVAIATAALVAVLAAWLMLAPLGASASPPPIGVAKCAAGQLRIDKVGGQGFTSHRQWDFVLRNITSHTCQVAGFPKVQLLDKNAGPMAVTVVHHGSSQGTVVLHTWQAARFSFVYVVAGPCGTHFFSAYGLRVAPGGISSSGLTFYAGRFDVCNVNIGGHPNVTAVH